MRFAILALMLSIGISVLAAPVDSHAESVERGPIRYDPDVVMHRQHNNQRRKVKDSESVEVVQRSPKESTPRTTKQHNNRRRTRKTLKSKSTPQHPTKDSESVEIVQRSPKESTPRAPKQHNRRRTRKTLKSKSTPLKDSQAEPVEIIQRSPYRYYGPIGGKTTYVQSNPRRGRSAIGNRKKQYRLKQAQAIYPPPPSPPPKA